MKALILAAGLGTRLRPITDHCPKSLVPVNGKPILIKQIENLHENGITDIVIISGYKAEVLEEAVHAIDPTIKIICSVDYANTNNMYSAYLAKDELYGEEFLMMNADVYFDSSIIKSLLAFSGANAIVTEIGKYNEESMKVIQQEADGEERLTKIAKTITKEDALGNSIDVYKFSAEGGKAFFDRCSYYIDEMKDLKKWSEVALNDILNDVAFYACPLDGRWFEIDNHEDLAAAEKLFAD